MQWRATAAEGVNAAGLAAEITRATAAEGVNAAGLAQEILDRAAAVSAEASARIADVNTEETRALAAEASLLAEINAEKSRLDNAGSFGVASDVPGGLYTMEWGAPGDGKPKITYAVSGGVVTMSVELN